MNNTTPNIETDIIEDLGVLTSPLRDSMSSGLAYLLRTIDGKQLFPLFFCKDFMQDFIKLQFSNSKNINSIPGILLPSPYIKIYPNFLTENSKLNILLVPHSKTSHYLKEELAKNCLLNTDLIKSYKNQLKIFESQLIKIGFINFLTEVTLKPVQYIYNGEKITQNVLSLDFDIAYVYKPELISLYMLLIRGFLTITMFISEYEDIYSFFRNISKFNLKYIAENDVVIFNSPEFQLHLPMYLEGKLATTNWDSFNKVNSYGDYGDTAHRDSGIYNYLLRTKLLTKNSNTNV